MKKVIAIIPARYASTRFPAKVLVDIKGKPMIERVFDRVNQVEGIESVFVATDSEKVYERVKIFTPNVLMTSSEHQSGTDRIAEAAQQLENEGLEFDFVINVQGDEPFIHPNQIKDLVSLLGEETHIGTLSNPIDDTEKLKNPNVVKVIFDKQGKAIYFSRHPIPYVRGVEIEKWLTKQQFYSHIGIYGYQKEVLQKLPRLSSSALEQAESLEQLRWLENGYDIQVGVTSYKSIGIDTPDDLEEALKFL